MKEKDILKTVAYMMAAEKVHELKNVMDNVLCFFEEYKIGPDEEMKKHFAPLLKEYLEWINGADREQDESEEER